MTKNQLYALIGPPHFHESVFHVRVWNYAFHFPRRTEC
ncbi:outer membrane protein assembly factor BamE [Paraburkholderia sp. OAS925]